MIAACPQCKARYRIERDRLPPAGARLRCSRCEAIFRVSPPAAGASAPEPEPAPRRAPEPGLEPALGRAPAPPAPEPAAPRPPARGRVLVADPDAEEGKALADALADWGFEPVLVHDGVEAILNVQRLLPELVVLDATLPKMFGFQVCELMKRNEELRVIPVVLVGAIHHRERYRREAAETYGADGYIERPGLVEGLGALLERLGLVGRAEPEREREAPPPAPPPVRLAPAPAPAAPAVALRPLPPPLAPRAPAPVPPPPAPRAPAPAPPPPPPRAPAPAPPPPPPRAPAPAPAAPPLPDLSDRVSGAARAAARQDLPPAATPRSAAGPDAATENARAERLARIIVSDIVLYNPEKFEAALRDGNPLEALDAELDEGRAHFRERIPERVRERRDFLGEELVRVARLRGMK